MEISKSPTYKQYFNTPRCLSQYKGKNSDNMLHNLWELTCKYCVYLELWTHKVLCGRFLCVIYIYKKYIFIHS